MANGRLPASQLGLLSTGHRLRADLIPQTEALRSAFRARFGKALTITGAYRTYAVQESLFRARYQTTPIASPDIRTWNGQRWYRKPGVAAAAVPGTSNHGLARAIDFSAGVNVGGSIEHTWMVAHAPSFGWQWPAWARRAPYYEPWHWESTGVAPVGNYVAIPGVNIPDLDLPDLTYPEEPMPTAAEIAREVWAQARTTALSSNPASGEPSTFSEMLAIGGRYTFFNWEMLRALTASQVTQDAQIRNLIGAVSALAGGENFDEAKLLAGVRAAAEAGAKAAVADGIELDITVTPREKD